MKFSIRYADKVVGVLVIVALAVLVVVIFMLGSSQRWFKRDIPYKTYFDSITGLSTNMPVLYKGFTIGHIKKISLVNINGNDTVEVNFTIYEEENGRVREGSVVELQASPIGLGNSFLFYPGTRGPLDAGSTIPEINSKLAKEYIEAKITMKPPTSDSIGEIINQVNSLLKTINVSLGGNKENEDPRLAKILENVNILITSMNEQLDPLLDNLNKTITELNTQITPILDDVNGLTNQLSAPDGMVTALLDAQGPVYTNIASTLESVSGIIKTLEKTIDYVPTMMPSVAILVSDLHSTLTEVEKLIVSLLNNPLLKSGVPEVKETSPGATGARNMNF